LIKHEEKELLYEILDENGLSNKEAKEHLHQALLVLKRLQLDSCYMDFNPHFGHCSYLFYVMIVKLYIIKKNYRWALHECLNVVHFELETCCQPRILYNIIDVLYSTEGQSMLPHLDEILEFRPKKTKWQSLKELFFKKPRYEEVIKQKCMSKEWYFQSNYRNALKSINTMIKISSEDKTYECDMVLVIDYMIDMVLNDLKYDYLSEIIYNPNSQSVRFSPFPLKYKDEKGAEHSICNENNLQVVDFSKDIVFSTPWHKGRMPKNINSLTKVPFCYYGSNHWGYYYPELKMCYIYNGNHSVAMGAKKKQGTMEIPVCSITPLFEHVYTDGAHWYSVHDDVISGNVNDFRFAVLYELAKRKNKL